MIRRGLEPDSDKQAWVRLGAWPIGSRHRPIRRQDPPITKLAPDHQGRGHEGGVAPWSSTIIPRLFDPQKLYGFPKNESFHEHDRPQQARVLRPKSAHEIYTEILKPAPMCGSTVEKRERCRRPGGSCRRRKHIRSGRARTNWRGHFHVRSDLLRRDAEPAARLPERRRFEPSTRRRTAAGVLVSINRRQHCQFRSEPRAGML